MIRIQHEDFDVGAELRRLTAADRGIGGLCTFVGMVRDGADGNDPIKSITLEHYPGMTEKHLARLEAEARNRWQVRDVLIIHRVGRLLAGDRIVLVAVASSHRQQAFDACQFLIDWLKTKAPFWKVEETTAGNAWVATRDCDSQAAARWERKESRREEGDVIVGKAG